MNEPMRMDLMNSKMFHALKAAAVPDNLAREAAEEIGSLEKRLSSLETKVNVLLVFVVINTVQTTILMIKAFAQ